MTDIETRWQAFLVDSPEFPERTLSEDGDKPEDKLLDMLYELSGTHYASTYLADIEETVWAGVMGQREWTELFPPSLPDDITRDQVREAIMLAGGMVLPHRSWIDGDGGHRFGCVARMRLEVAI